MARDNRSDDEGFPSAGAPPRRLTPADVQQVQFGRTRFRRGYSELDVDAFLDEVSEEFARLHAENRRLQEEAQFLRTEPIARGGDADEVLRRAKEEAARTIADAEARAAALLAASGGSDPLGPGAEAGKRPFVDRFVAREREFLQGLAALIQRHAEAVKEDVRAAREVSGQGQAAPAETAAWPPGRGGEGEGEGGHDPAGGGAGETVGGILTGPEVAVGARRPGGSAVGRGFEGAGDALSEGGRPARDAGGRAAAERPDEGDGSLRELFWGED